MLVQPQTWFKAMLEDPVARSVGGLHAVIRSSIMTDIKVGYMVTATSKPYSLE